jgi:hypothetical protein
VSDLLTVYVSIGNSDDRLSQRRWRDFWHAVSTAITQHAVTVHGEWHSNPVSEWQNACWCAEVHVADATGLKAILASTAATFGQDSIVWAVADPEFLFRTDQ